MNPSKLSALASSLALLGAATTLGFVWFGREEKRKGRRTERLGQANALEGRGEPDAVARDDAFRDFHGASPEDEAEQGLVDPIEVEPLGDALFPNDEQYDALAPEDLGSEWLRRATQADTELRPKKQHE